MMSFRSLKVVMRSTGVEFNETLIHEPRMLVCSVYGFCKVNCIQGILDNPPPLYLPSLKHIKYN